MKKPIRRLISAALAASLIASSVETVVGEVRDGDVHHETSVEALSHNAAVPLGHGHQADPLTDSEQERDDHEHDSSADHCTHVHGIALPAVAVRMGSTVDVWVRLAEELASVNQVPTNPIPHPPRV